MDKMPRTEEGIDLNEEIKNLLLRRVRKETSAETPKSKSQLGLRTRHGCDPAPTARERSIFDDDACYRFHMMMGQHLILRAIYEGIFVIALLVGAFTFVEYWQGLPLAAAGAVAFVCLISMRKVAKGQKQLKAKRPPNDLDA
jgi:hypothetical protein